ncbi:unnamed protein product [Lymnaea stagnalis]|uniref:Uncharacterized protein n=1 Tax=Lymnaea stagnalis TaxID=6523 RepID=A0AAV2H374_LYMST
MAPTASSTTVKISETNILITDSEDSLFVELEGKANESLLGVRLSVYNATSPLPVGGDASLSTLLEGTLDEQGRQVITKINNKNLNWKAISVFESVLIILAYNDKQESLIYSSKGDIDPGIAEKYNTSYNLILDTKRLEMESLSLSRCSQTVDTSGFVLTHATKGKPNNCTLSSSHNLEMKLTRKGCTIVSLPPDYNLTIANKIISEVNSKSHCGFSRLMLKDLQGSPACLDNEKTALYVTFQVLYELPKQLALVLSGYQSFILDEGSPPNVLNLAEDVWVISNCTENCLPAVKPPDSGDDDRIRVTVAVVVSCIGVFLIVLVFVIIYMKNKRRGILQFRMTRLDDDEDDLIGDMDDFVGNQGPTFRNFS